MKNETEEENGGMTMSGSSRQGSADDPILDAAQRRLLREAFEELVPLPQRIGELFYRRLFELDPSLRSMFGDDLGRQASMLVNALTVAVMSFLDERRGARAVRELGARHAAYGVVDRHYETFGQALLWTFEQRFADRFTPPLRAAWNQAWREISQIMQEAASEGAKETPSEAD